MDASIEFNTPLDKNKWIDAWLAENNAKIEMRNFKDGKESQPQSIEKAIDKIFPTVGGYNENYRELSHPQYSMTIPLIDRTYYSETIPVAVRDDIIASMRAYDELQIFNRFVEILKRDGYSFQIDVKTDAITITHGSGEEVNLSDVSAIPQNTVFKNKGDLDLGIGEIPQGVKFLNDGNVHLEKLHAIEHSPEFSNNGDVSANRLRTIASDLTFSNKGNVCLWALDGSENTITFNNKGEVQLDDMKHIPENFIMNNTCGDVSYDQETKSIPSLITGCEDYQADNDSGIKP